MNSKGAFFLGIKKKKMPGLATPAPGRPALGDGHTHGDPASGGRPELGSATAPNPARPAPSALRGRTEPRGSVNGPGSERGPACGRAKSSPLARPHAGKPSPGNPARGTQLGEPRSGRGSFLLAMASEAKGFGQGVRRRPPGTSGGPRTEHGGHS